MIMSACGDDDDYSPTTSPRIDRDREAPETTEAPAELDAPTPIAGDSSERLGEGPEEPPATTVPPDTTFEDYGANPFEDPMEDEFSTFAVDVDTGSYTLARAWINAGVLPDRDSVRVEEYVNYFDGGYPAPEDSTFAVYADAGPTPYWDSDNEILRIGIQAREVTIRTQRVQEIALDRRRRASGRKAGLLVGLPHVA